MRNVDRVARRLLERLSKQEYICDWRRILFNEKQFSHQKLNVLFPTKIDFEENLITHALVCRTKSV